MQLTTRILPFLPTSLRRALDRALLQDPEIVVLLGETPSDELRLARVALNRHASLTGLGGPKPIAEGAPVAYFNPVPLEAAAKAAKRLGIRMQVFSQPEPSVVNGAYFHLLHRRQRQGGEGPATVLVEIPIRSRSLSLQDATRGVLSLVRFLVGARGSFAGRASNASKRPGSTPAAGRKA